MYSSPGTNKAGIVLARMSAALALGASIFFFILFYQDKLPWRFQDAVLSETSFIGCIVLTATGVLLGVFATIMARRILLLAATGVIANAAFAIFLTLIGMSNPPDIQHMVSGPALTLQLRFALRNTTRVELEPLNPTDGSAFTSICITNSGDIRDLLLGIEAMDRDVMVHGSYCSCCVKPFVIRFCKGTNIVTGFVSDRGQSLDRIDVSSGWSGGEWNGVIQLSLDSSSIVTNWLHRHGLPEYLLRSSSE